MDDREGGTKRTNTPNELLTVRFPNKIPSFRDHLSWDVQPTALWSTAVFLQEFTQQRDAEMYCVWKSDSRKTWVGTLSSPLKNGWIVWHLFFLKLHFFSAKMSKKGQMRLLNGWPIHTSIDLPTPYLLIYKL